MRRARGTRGSAGCGERGARGYEMVRGVPGDASERTQLPIYPSPRRPLTHQPLSCAHDAPFSANLMAFFFATGTSGSAAAPSSSCSSTGRVFFIDSLRNGFSCTCAHCQKLLVPIRSVACPHTITYAPASESVFCTVCILHQHERKAGQTQPAACRGASA